MNSMLVTVAIVTLVILIAVIVVLRVKYKNLKQQIEQSVKDLQEKEVILQKEAMIKAKEALQNDREQLNIDERERRREFAAIENKLTKREDILENKIQEVTDKEVELDKMKDKLIEREDLLDEIVQKQTLELERIAGMSADEAKKVLMEQLKKDLAQEQLQLIRDNEAIIKETALEKSKEILSTTMQRCMMEQVVESTVSVVSLPNDEMKGRIIGRDGRNIKSLEQILGVDIIIDDTPEALTISCFNPVRREIASRALNILIKDGRIQPGRIEEVVAKCQKEVNEVIRKAGEDAVNKLGIVNMNKELIALIGRLKYRTSYGQNQLAHSIETAQLCGTMASELGLNAQLAKRAALLHDLGKGLDFEMEGSHIELGSRFAKKYGENDIVINAIESHHGDVPCKSIIGYLVQAADTLSAARPGARSETLETYIKRVEQLETICKSYDGVQNCYAMQSGREVRVMVIPEKINDLQAFKLASDIKDRIEKEMTYPGQIKVNVIREYRAIETAK